MSQLSSIFEGVACKVLTGNEFKNQHEFQGVHSLRKILGDDTSSKTFQANYFLFKDVDEVERLQDEATWYDARNNDPNRKAEFRLYYSAMAEDLVRRAQEGDTLIICKIKGASEILIILAEAGSSILNSLEWLFRLDKQKQRSPLVKGIGGPDDREIGWLENYILEELGYEEVVPATSDYDEILLERFGLQLPTTRVFSAFAREIAAIDYACDDPDAALLKWYSTEDMLFRRMEKRIVEARLQKGFVVNGDADVDGFIKFSLSVQNRRKSRAGLAFENHLSEIFKACELKFDEQAITEGKKKPDFLFPGKAEYHSPDFPEIKLTLLAAKSTCKDRWRQALSEAKRIQRKHLVTLEPGISSDQTDEMRSSLLTLVVPEEIQSTYSSEQCRHILKLSNFIELVRAREV
ncbi:type II restriction endonuclease [Paremcibacter congregatus]|uniref:type II restriction endonuclease n=1 Tax=Paremcibacter congregatus TaxID=2043170 RepID=UPI0030EBB5BF|tara:strand:+ start:6699 stop:7916 length:1218 start_codon:yes stop_codon:yes gene_type:complete